jgi:colicin import membrane protein
MRLEPVSPAATTTDLAVLTAVSIVPADFFKPNGSDEVLARLEEEVRKQASVLDISTETGRAAIASLAYKVARSKTALDEQGKSLVVDKKAEIGAIDKERSRVWDRCEKLQLEVRQPLTDWENAEKDRVLHHENALRLIEDEEQRAVLWQYPAEIRAHVDATNFLFASREWEEFVSRARTATTRALNALDSALATAEKKEAEQLEAARLRAEAQERAIKEREEAAARAAKEAAERRAEEQARLAYVAAERDRQRVENERAEAEARAKQAEAQRIAQEALAERLLAEAEARRVAEQQAASQRAKEAQERAERDRIAAVEAERLRVAEEKRREAEEAEKRANNKARQTAVNRDILAALAKLGIPEDIGREIVIAMAKGQIPHVTVAY